MTYQRNRRMSDEVSNTKPAQKSGGNPEEAGIRVNGFKQVIEMLEYADPEFRESLLRRIAHQDPVMAKRLRSQLNRMP